MQQCFVCGRVDEAYTMMIYIRRATGRHCFICYTPMCMATANAYGWQRDMAVAARDAVRKTWAQKHS